MTTYNGTSDAEMTQGGRSGSTGVGIEYTAKTLTGAAVLSYPKTQCVLSITNDLKFYSTHTMPSRWKRFWYKALLGWTWGKA